MPNHKFCIVNFHGIGSPGRPLEEGEEHYWISEEKYLRFLDQICPVKEKVFITFDDGNMSDLKVGANGLAERGLKATFFPLAGRLDTPGSLGSEELRELIRLGHKIGSHGYDHVNWKNLNERGVQRELIDARAILEDCIGDKISEAAIPFGSYGKSILQRLKVLGYQRVFSSDGGSFRGTPYPTPRWSVRADTSEMEVADFLSGRESFARRVRRSLAKTKKQIL
jgi:peptidoglycan/xylan/chitin deacetylase (PgdA/CDA1 family)